MLQNIKEIYGKKLAAADGDIGHVKDFYFDDKTWAIRYMVVDTGSWLTGRLVLLSPHAVGKLEPGEKAIPVHLTKKQIEDSPPIESHQPVSRQYEIDYFNYYGWPIYWQTGSPLAMPILLPPSKAELAQRSAKQPADDKHLQSTRDITGYRIHTSDGEIGHVTGFLVDERSWDIREVVVDLGVLSFGKEVLISVATVDRVSYPDSNISVKLTKAEIQHTPESGAVIGTR